MKFFYDPDTGKKFRSLKSARKHLEEKDKNKNLQNLQVLELCDYFKNEL